MKKSNLDCSNLQVLLELDEREFHFAFAACYYLDEHEVWGMYFTNHILFILLPQSYNMHSSPLNTKRNNCPRNSITYIYI